jgi:hypothetical protein
MKNALLVYFILFGFQPIIYGQAEYAVIGASDVTMRAEGNSKGKKMAKVQMGEMAKILQISDKSEYIKGTVDADESCNEFHWYKLEFEGKTGWVFGAFVFELQDIRYLGGENSKLLRIANAYSRNSGGDMCYGNNFICLLSDDYKKSLKAYLPKGIKDKNSYRGIPGLGFDMGILTSFINSNGNVTVATGGAAPGDYEEISVYEFQYSRNGDYIATLKYSDKSHLPD